MDQKNGHQNNEKRLFHGTAEDTVQKINAKGFNRSYAGKNGKMFMQHLKKMSSSLLKISY